MVKHPLSMMQLACEELLSFLQNILHSLVYLHHPLILAVSTQLCLGDVVVADIDVDAVIDQL